MELTLPQRGRKTTNCGYSIAQDTVDFVADEAARLGISKSALVGAIIEAYREISGDATLVKAQPTTRLPGDQIARRS